MGNVLNEKLNMKPIRYIESINVIKNCRSYLTSELFFRDLKLNYNDYTIESDEDVEVVIHLIEALSIIVKSYHAEWRMVIEDESNLGAVPKGIARKFLMSYVNKKESLLIKGEYCGFIGIYSLESNERVASITSRYYGIF